MRCRHGTSINRKAVAERACDWHAETARLSSDARVASCSDGKAASYAESANRSQRRHLNSLEPIEHRGNPSLVIDPSVPVLTFLGS